MLTYERNEPDSGVPRAHPWTDARSNAAFRYYNFKSNPELIRSSLEDISPWEGYPAAETFYLLVEWLNFPGGRWESNDCAFNPPGANESPQFKKNLVCSGRIMVLYRSLLLNLSRPRLEHLESSVHGTLAGIDREFKWGAVATSIMRTKYISLPVSDKDNTGYQLMLSFWAWGDDEAETMSNLDRVLVNLREALQKISLDSKNFS